MHGSMIVCSIQLQLPIDIGKNFKIFFLTLLLLGLGLELVGLFSLAIFFLKYRRDFLRMLENQVMQIISNNLFFFALWYLVASVVNY